MGLPIALLYGWKHMDEAASYTVRGRLGHDFPHKALVLMWSVDDLAQAEDAIAAAEHIDDLSHEVKAAAKASSIVRAFNEDATAQVLH